MGRSGTGVNVDGRLRDARLAINGGPPTRRRPWLDNFTTGEEERAAALAALDTGYLSLFEGSHAPEAPFSFDGGPFVQRLEWEWAAYYEVPHAVTMNSATSCLYAAIGALGIGYGDEVIVSPYTMSACAVCALVYGAIPVFADVDPRTGSLAAASIAARLSPRTKAIVVVHQFGIPADMDPIMALAREHGLKVVEDCAQAHAARYKGRLVGTIGDIGVFSLNVNKTIQTGEGGVCITRDAELRYRLALIRNHGEAVVGAAGYERITNILGFNYRMTEVTAAIGSEQLKKLDGLTETRVQYVAALSEALQPLPFLDVPPVCAHASFGEEARCGCRSTYYVFPIQFDADRFGADRATFMKAATAEGLGLSAGYVRPLYLQPVYQRRDAFKHGYPWSAPENRDSQPDYSLGSCPAAERLHFERMLLSEYVRPPHTRDDVLDIARGLHKMEGLAFA
jgi:perosamine synthetase